MEAECYSCGEGFEVADSPFGYRRKCPSCGKLNILDRDLGVKGAFDDYEDYHRFLGSLRV